MKRGSYIQNWSQQQLNQLKIRVRELITLENENGQIWANDAQQCCDRLAGALCTRRLDHSPPVPGT